MTLTIAVLSDVHGNVAALDAALADIATRTPDRLLIAGDLVHERPAPGGGGGTASMDLGTSRRPRRGRATPTSRSPTATTPRRSRGWTRCRPRSGRPPSGRATSSATSSWTGCAGLPGRAARVGRARRSRSCATPRPAARPRACRPTSTRPTTVERVTRTDARVICCGHTHVADVRELGRKLIVNPGSCGFAFDGDPGAGWALLHLSEEDEPSAEPPSHGLRRPVGGRGGLGSGARRRRVPRRDRAHRAVRAMSERRRVVITGFGAVTPLGTDAETFVDPLLAGESGVRTITSFDASRVTTRIAGEVPGLRPVARARPQGDPAQRPHDADRARRHARRDGHGRPPGVPRGRARPAHGHHHRLRAGRHGHAHRPDRPRTPPGVPTGSPRSSSPWPSPTWHRVRWPSTSGPRARTSRPRAPVPAADTAIGEAAEMILRGDADAMFAGGTEATVYEATVGGFSAMRALSTRNDDPAGASRPVRLRSRRLRARGGRRVVALEELGHARARGAPILAELCGYGATADASHITSPAPGGEGAFRPAGGPS